MTTHCQALRWIVALLGRMDVPFQAVGGLAAHAYGAQRPLADLDFYIPTSRLDDVADEAGDFVSRPPSHFRSDSWDLTFMKIEREGRLIELGGADGARYFDRQACRWREAGIDFGVSVERTLCGVSVPVMPRHQLIEYKERLDREVDRQDVADLVGENQRIAG
jgi:hypothetical protein